MSVALPIESRDLASSDWLEPGVVAVHRHGFGHSVAVCSCGWTGHRRLIKAAAQQDAWVHSMHRKCRVSVPLVIRVTRLALPCQNLLQH
jgi:hypothetical protein